VGKSGVVDLEVGEILLIMHVSKKNIPYSIPALLVKPFVSILDLRVS